MTPSDSHLHDTWIIHYAAKFHRALKTQKGTNYKRLQQIILQFEDKIVDPVIKEAFNYLACKTEKISEDAKNVCDYWLQMADSDC